MISNAQADEHGDKAKPVRGKGGKYGRARIRNFIFTIGPHHLTGGRSTRRHLKQDVVKRELEISTPLWPAAFEGLRIAHVSDFHLGHLLPRERALAVVDIIAEQEPDLVACTGDVVDLDNHEAMPLLEALGQVKAPLGSLLVLGNHDHLHDAPGLTRMAGEAGLTVLENQTLRVARGRDQLLIGGIDWAKSATQCAKLVSAACGDFVHLLLAHNPKAFARATDLRIPLTLAGHTHGGQLARKQRPEHNLAFYHRHRAGLYDSGGSRLYVTSGVGAWFPLRVNCPPEVAILTMRRGDVPAHEEGVGAKACRFPRRGRAKRGR